ncbi:MAG: cupin domain-containing protein [Pyrinomonadaceae bacterium]
MKHTVAQDALCERAALYALGALNQHEARAFEEHIAEGCEACEAELRPFESVTAAIGFAAPEAEPPRGAREKLLARMAEDTPPPARSGASSSKQVDPSKFLTVRAHEGEWKKATEGIFIKQLFVDETKGTVTTLFKMLPGTYVPAHRHLGVEECYIIEGDFHSHDEILGPGDFTIAMKDSVHHRLYTENGALLLIVTHEGYEVLAQA